jgi:DnaJ domain
MADDEATLSGFFEELSRQDGNGSRQEGSSSGTGDGIAEAKKEEVYRDPEEDDLLAGFFKDVLEPKKDEEDSQKKPKVAVSGNDGDVASAVRDETERTDKYTNQDLGSSLSQYNRLMAKNYEWRNLNPYLVLQLDIDATEEDIKQRYRKLAARLHPDKLRGVEFPVECFEQVKIAYQKLQDPKQKEIIIKNIEKIRADTTKEHKKLLAKGVSELFREHV